MSFDVDAYADLRTSPLPAPCYNLSIMVCQALLPLPHGRLVLPSVPEPKIVQPNQKELICRGIQILEEEVIVRGQP